MQVSCGQCGMRYEFDASEIPAEGYDAQCSNCNSIFFVAPEAPVGAADDFALVEEDASVAPQVSVQVAIGCPQCGAVYQFDSLDVPEAGYDAQCTQCEAIFLVAPHTVAPREGTAPPPPPPVDDETSFASVNELLGQAESPPATPQAPETPLDAGFTNDDANRTRITPVPDLGTRRTWGTPTAEAQPPAAPAAESDAAKPGFTPELLDGGTFERTDPYMRVPEGYSGYANPGTPAPPEPPSPEPPQATYDARPAHEEQSNAAPEPRDTQAAGAYDHNNDDNAHTQVNPPRGDDTRNTVISAAPNAPAPNAPAANEPSITGEAPPSYDTAVREAPAAPQTPHVSTWASAAELAGPVGDGPSDVSATILQGPGSDTVDRLPAGALPGGNTPDNDDAQRQRNAPIQDAAAARRRRSRSEATPPQGRALRIVLVLLAVLLGGLWFINEKRPELIAQLVQGKPQRHAVASEAVTLFEQGKKALLRDTDADYETAIDTLGRALQQDTQYDDALAWQVVAHSLRGADLRREGARMYADWEQEQALWRGLKALERQGATLSPAQAIQSQQLEEQGPKHLQEATETLERGGKELSVAQVQAQRARAFLPRSATIAAAAALCYTQTPSDMAVAQSLLGQHPALAANGEADGTAPKNAPAARDIWLLLAQGRVAATQEKTREEARAAFTQAVQIEPNLVRAQWELAQLESESGQPDAAKKRYQDILSAVPNHPKSMAALAALEHPRPTAGESPAPTAQPQGTPTGTAAQPDLDSIAPAAGDNPNGEAPVPVKRGRHRRRMGAPGVQAAPGAQPEPSLEEPSNVPEPAPPGNE